MKYEMMIPYGVPMKIILEIEDSFDVEIINESENEIRFLGELEEIEKADVYMREAMQEWVNQFDKKRSNAISNRKQRKVTNKKTKE